MSEPGLTDNSKLPIDPDVKVPPSVAAASAAADAAHAAAYNTQPAPAAPSPPPPEPIPPPPPPPAPQGHTPEYFAMKGRFDQSQMVIGGLQEQMTELGTELARAEAQLRSMQAERVDPNQGQRRPGQAPRRMITDEDVNTYGPELIDFVRRAAVEAVAPEIDQTRQQVRQVSQRVGSVAQADTMGVLDRDIPDWRQINNSPRFKQWCRLPDVYSGRVRAELLNAAFQAADAPRVVAFFRGFLAEEQATGQLSSPQDQPVTIPPRQAAMSLESIAAPGAAKPAGGTTPGPAADKPVFTRAQISYFYSQQGRAAYVGRDSDRQRDEEAIFAAQRDGRVRG